MDTKKDRNYMLTGRITNLQGEPLAGLLVRAYDHDPITADDFLSEVVTDAAGRYAIRFSPRQLGVEIGGPDVFIRVYAAGRLLGQSPIKSNQQAAIHIDLQVDHAVATPNEPPRFVSGVIRDARNAVLRAINIGVFDRDLRADQLLGQARTDDQGGYRIGYYPRQFRRAEKGSADSVVKVFGLDGTLLITSPVMFNAPPEAVIDLTIPAGAFGPTLFESLRQVLPPLLEDLRIEDLEEDKDHQDVSFLTGETGFSKDDLGRFVLAHRLATERLEVEFWFVLLGGSFYTFTEGRSLKEQLAGILDRIPSLDEKTVRKSLARGFHDKEISESLGGNTEAWVAAFLALLATRWLERPTLVRLALDDAGMGDSGKREEFARLYNEHRANRPALIQALEKSGRFEQREIADLHVSIDLADLTQADFSVVKAIKEDFGIRQPEQVRRLAKKSEQEWVQFVKARHAAGEIKLPTAAEDLAGVGTPPEPAIYARTLALQFREAFPTTAFAGGLDRALQNGGSHGLRQPRELSRFLELHEDFELLNTPVDDFLMNRVHSEFRFAKDEGFRREVKAVQRVFKLVPTFEATDALLADDLHSAQKVYRMGKSEFVRRYEKSPGFTTDTARQAWNRAADTHAAVLTIVGDLKAYEVEDLPMALKKKDGEDDLATFPNWDNLFKTGDLCDCEHCRSVLSPAAYFADLLMFLKDRKAANPARTVKDILFDRRPDLGFLELNCENALTTIPFVDVVCEVLEAVIADGENDLELPGFTVMPAGDAAAKAAVEAAFTAQDITLGESFTLSQVSPADPDRWVAHGEDITYLLKKKTTANFFAEILRNTKASAEELRAYPQYVNPKAYEKLRAAKYPLGLPFDLFAEEVRAAFQKANLKRWELMQVLHASAAPNNPTAGEIACEYFGISADPAATFDEKRLILVADATVGGQQVYWGETGASWLNLVGKVSTFLRKTGLEYNGLLAMLDLKFINPAGDITIRHDDGSCDTDKKFIQVLNATKLDRIHRFLRLWRKLSGWKMWELDLAIDRLGGGSLDEVLLIHLQYFSQLRTRLGPKTEVEQLVALFGDLNNQTRFTKLHEKREDAHYQKLFLNKRLIQPIDPAFIDLPAGETITGHRTTVLAALGLREADLLVIQGLTKASDGLPYIDDNLTLANLSFVWRHGWLSKLLKFKAEEWSTILRLRNQDLALFANPQAAWSFVEQIDFIKAAGFSPDELKWLLAADLLAKAAVKETDAARFLTALRTELQAIQAEYGVTPPTDEPSLTALLTSLLQKLNRDEAAASAFLKTLKGAVTLEAGVDGMPLLFAFPGAISGAPNHIPIEYDEPNGVLRFTGQMTDAQRDVLLTDALLAAVTANPSYATAIQDLLEQSAAAIDNFVSVEVEVPLPGGVVLPANLPSLPIHDTSTPTIGRLTFTGLMTDAERVALIAAGNPAGPIDELFRLPRLGVKFYEPIFTEPLAKLPSAIDFKAQATPELAAKISYDVERRLLRFAGFMSTAEQTALNALAPAVLPEEIAYHAAVNSLAAQPQTIPAADERVWLTDTDLDTTLPANDTLVERLTNATTKALAYLRKSLAITAVIQQCSAQLGLTEAVANRLLSDYALLPDTLLVHLTGPFAATSSVVDRATLPDTFDGWYWANRSASLLKKWKVTLAEFEKLGTLTAGAQLLDLLSLPLNETDPVAPIDRFVRTSRLFRLRDSIPETAITLFEVLEKLSVGSYATSADFAADVELLDEDWLAVETEALTGSLDLAYPADYLLAENWERLRRAFYFLDKLNSNTATASSFAAVAMTPLHASTLKDALRSKFGTETWLTLSAEIQDVLRERKRDALSAYLLTHPQPDPPSGKWENTNDLYAYYLLDVEMCSCMLTSRLVQGSGSIQLFVQRCFMGLEPKVEVKADGDDGDSAWKWWKWMSKYRVWEANRKVFLWPENWIEPELKIDRSPFFKDLENELQQNEIDQYSAETAFSNYLEKLHGVAQLEIAGFYQEDNADQTIVHVFGRTPGAEPHLYYYRRYDYRQWSPWEKVELDIQGDYLIPAVVAQRLYLFWPIFTEIPDEEKNSETQSVTLKVDNTTPTSFTPNKAQKKLRLQMAVSDYRQGKWTPKRVSKDFDETDPYGADIVKRHYQFRAIDGSSVNGRFAVEYEGWAVGSDGGSYAGLGGAFEIAGCAGVPEKNASTWGYFAPAIRAEWASAGSYTENLKWVELQSRHDPPSQDFTLQHYLPFSSSDNQFTTPVLWQTPWIYQMTPAWFLTYLDRLWLDGKLAFPHDVHISRTDTPMGSWSPYFYNDKKRTFFVMPAAVQRKSRGFSTNNLTGQSIRWYYPEIKKVFRAFHDFFEGSVRTWLDSIDVSTLAPAQQQAIDEGLWQAFPEEAPAPSTSAVAPYTEAQIVQVRDLLTRFFMRYFHYMMGWWSLALLALQQFHFKNHYHPFVCDFAKLVYNPLKGIPAMMSRETQLKNSGFSFLRTYQPTEKVVEQGVETFYPREVVDFDSDGAYAPYNWELFYHAPLLIANSLSRNQRFEEAQDWYHFIFNPIGVTSPTPGGSAMSKYWITKPFFEATDEKYIQQRIENIMLMLAGDTSIQGFSPQLKKDLEDQVLDWRTYPFEPHRIANYRTVAYQKTVVMKYLDNLIAWGDYLFRQDSMESVNEATQLYIMAAEILGPKPMKVPPQVKPPLESFNELEDEFDTFSNALVEVENLIPPMPGDEPEGSDPAPLPMLYFCIPHNEKLLSYWDTVADRLYKLRHCMNIEGVVRQLSLFEPPIDPGALVKAVAGGIDISSAIADLNAPLPLYRFSTLLQKANEVCNDVKALGTALLAALEKKDAEGLALLRQSLEIRVLEAVKSVREQQIAEANENLLGLQKNKELVTLRRDFYQSVEKINDGESLQQDKLEEALLAQQISQVINIAASVAHIVPTFDLGVAGFGGSPKAAIMFGGPNVGAALQAAAGGFTFWANVENYHANKASIDAGHKRRWEDWKLQERLANKELEQIEKQIASSQLKIDIANKELENQVLQIDNAKATDAFMRSKYTNLELYQWQISQISGVYFQSYRLAYDLAKRAERCLRFELGLADSSYINFGYWDSLKKGLLSGDKLQYDLRRLEVAHMERNRREFELTKHVSLAMLDPLALVKLRETGRCFIRLPEELFDLDFPGHYFRRIKSVSLTLPCVVGPYTTISCTLRLLKNSIRIDTTNGDNGYTRNTDDAGLPADDGRFIENNIPVKAIAASNAQNDSGMFELNFRDERYLPFEGAGAISDWALDLFNDLPANNPDPGAPDFGKPLRQFDYSTISDAILHVKYTSREDAGPFKNGAIQNLRDLLSADETTPSMRMFDLRKEFPAQWHRFLHPANPADGNVFELDLSSSHFRVLDQAKTLNVNSIILLARCTEETDYDAEWTWPTPASPPAGENEMTLVRVNQYGGLHFNKKSVVGWDIAIQPNGATVKWQLKMRRDDGGNLQEDPVTKAMEVGELLLVVGYEWDY